MVFYPHNGVSLVQKTQMTTQEGENVTVCAVKGNFDDCQTGVKKAFRSLGSWAEEHGYRLSSANSINIGRLAPQTVYYFAAYRDLVNSGRIKVGDKVDYCVPTGNFGDILAGYWAKLMGLPVGRLICASNKNRILTDFFNTGIYDVKREFFKTSSPSMDILVSSNLERLLYLAFDKDQEKVCRCMEKLQSDGVYAVSSDILEKLSKDFSALCCTEEESQKAIADVWKNYSYLMDPHTSVAWHCAMQNMGENPVVVLSTASPYKFPQSVLKALGQETHMDEFDLMDALNKLTGVPVPKNLSGLKGRKARFDNVIENNGIEDYVKEALWK